MAFRASGFALRSFVGQLPGTVRRRRHRRQLLHPSNFSPMSNQANPNRVLSEAWRLGLCFKQELLAGSPQNLSCRRNIPHGAIPEFEIHSLELTDEKAERGTRARLWNLQAGSVLRIGQLIAGPVASH